jgi:hypothetical protein
MFCPYVWQLDPGHTYDDYLVLVLKLGVTEWYQSHVDHRNANLDRGVIFLNVISNQNYFYLALFKNFYSITHLCPISYLFINLYHSDGKRRKLQFQQWWQQWRWEPTLNAWAIVDRPGPTSSNRTTNLGANVRCQSIDTIYRSMILIKKEKG